MVNLKRPEVGNVMNHKISLDGMLFGRGRGIGPRELINLAVNSGVDGIQWPWSIEEYKAKESEKFYCEIVARGLSIPGIWMTKHQAAFPFGKKLFMNEVERCIELANIMKSNTIECWPINRSYCGLALPALIGRFFLRNHFDKVSDLLISEGKKLAIEFHPKAALKNYNQSFSFLKDMPPCFVITVDTYHSNNIGDEPSQIFSICSDRVGVIHLSGSHRGRLDSAGDIFDYGKILKNAILKGFYGELVIQYQDIPNNDPKIKNVVSYIRYLLNKIYQDIRSENN